MTPRRIISDNFPLIIENLANKVKTIRNFLGKTFKNI